MYEEVQYSYVYKILGRIFFVEFCLALKQTKAGPRGSGTPVLVLPNFNRTYIITITRGVSN